jgi:regulator of protease activity HflC (stomatin/prohibitin superfamily)
MPAFAGMTSNSDSSHYAAVMTVRSRKLIGTIMLLFFLALYATAAAVIGSGRIALAPQWVQFAFFLTTGLLWIIPAGLLIRWMQRPDEP